MLTLRVLCDACKIYETGLHRTCGFNGMKARVSHGHFVTISEKSIIYGLALVAETSPSTVSAILNGTSQERRASRETAERVLALADRRSTADRFMSES